MSQCFFRGTPLWELEREMMLVPGFDHRKENTVTDCRLCNKRNRKQPCRLTQCTYLNDRITSGKLSLDDLAWTMYRRYPSLLETAGCVPAGSRTLFLPERTPPSALAAVARPLLSDV